jgi:linearmycin/streptolysin S transport system ATP-binding protein
MFNIWLTPGIISGVSHTFTYMIEISKVTKKYGALVALDSVSLSIREKEFFGLLGPNGAGKTTLMNILIGYIDPDDGEATVLDKKVKQSNLETRKFIGLVPQSLAIYEDISALENLEIFGSLYDIDKAVLKERIKEKLNSVGLYERRKDKVKTFSGGMKRRLNLIASLLHDPPILLCDEPTVGIDPQSRNAIFDYLTSLNENGKTIIYTTHYMEEAERLCTRLAIIDSGRIISEGTLTELMEKSMPAETMLIVKNQETNKIIDEFKRFGSLVTENDHYELILNKGVRLSELYQLFESHSISYKYTEIRPPTLEALFLTLTGKSLRD